MLEPSASPVFDTEDRLGVLLDVIAGQHGKLLRQAARLERSRSSWNLATGGVKLQGRGRHRGPAALRAQGRAQDLFGGV
ncbi:hypothetical protein NDU88_005977 [Pleurodeles waltl]|uniref:Uncharacterized protein n=1 Tax=Pleurodeles waltl TaxID=8319 RepID=A0AAV7TC72_PLEWA|nr:hypothetical protein NDU88_005977 [Pleurodeles waltl]